ncbi:TIGR04255 family protein [Sinomonas terrae]|uniref:TIGR04255 family protein n=1 Tax=Sinomonas terrae TaxID=2908838 RepID=A0ABS9U753_9MICC|nr:TIGR04255 family protein [Sinomonas terrae]MCH6472524.1 TIGR04255 family protein [Sinomonas terrae]
MYPQREVFPNSPLALVAAEIRFTDAPRLRQQETLDGIAVALEHLLPIQVQHQQALNVQVVVPGQQPQVQFVSGRTMKNVASTSAMTLFPDRLAFETTDYTDFGSFREAVLACTSALVESRVTPAIQRIGLRYLDEIRVPSAPTIDAREWGEWIDNRLVDQLRLGPSDAPIVRAEGFISYDLTNRRGLNFRFAALQSGAVVVSSDLIRRPFSQELPLFVLDFDGYEDFTMQAATLLDVNVVARTLDAVHGPAGATFQNVITDKARDLFRERSRR